MLMTSHQLPPAEGGLPAIHLRRGHSPLVLAASGLISIRTQRAFGSGCSIENALQAIGPNARASASRQRRQCVLTRPLVKGQLNAVRQITPAETMPGDKRLKDRRSPPETDLT